MLKHSIIAIDVGLKRIGVAMCVQDVVLPLDSIVRKNRNQAARDVSIILEQRSADTLVVGLPSGVDSSDAKNVDSVDTASQALAQATKSSKSLESLAIDLGILALFIGQNFTDNEQARRILHFVSLLTFKNKIYFVNEDFTSYHASFDLAHMRKSKRKSSQKDGKIDSISACKILQIFLNLVLRG